MKDEGLFIMVTGCLGKLVGFSLILLGFWIGLTALAFASIIDPQIQGQAWWDEYWKRMGEGGGWDGVAMGLLMVIVGGVLLVRPTNLGSEVEPGRPKKPPEAPKIA